MNKRIHQQKATTAYFFIALMLFIPNVYANHLTTADGAIGDGRTDDTVKLQAALTYCSERGVVCEIPAGKTHYVTGPLFLWGRATLTSSSHGGITFNVPIATSPYLLNLGIKKYSPHANPTLFTGKIAGVRFTMAGGSTTLGAGRIIVFWHSSDSTISENYFDIGPYAYSATGGGRNHNYVTELVAAKNLTIINNTVVASARNIGSEGISLGYTDADKGKFNLVQGNVITGVGDDPIGIHYCRRVKVLSNTVRSTDGRIYVANSQEVEIANNKAIRIPSRIDGSVYQGIGLIYIGYERAGLDTLPSDPIYPESPVDAINIHDNALYYPRGSIDAGGAIRLAGVRNTTVSNNTIVNDSASPSLYAIHIASQDFHACERDSSTGRCKISEPHGRQIPKCEKNKTNGECQANSINSLMLAYDVLAWVDPTGVDMGFFNHYNYARTHKVNLVNNVSGTTAGSGARALNFTMVGSCELQVGPVTLTNNLAPAYDNFYSMYQSKCKAQPGLIISNPNPNVSTTTTFPDTDSDGYPDLFDNCPSVFNPDQADADGDGVGNVCGASSQAPSAPVIFHQ